METVVSMIASLGFPIVACLYMAQYVKKQTDTYREDVKELQKEHKDEISKVVKALNDNTIAIQKLCDKIGGVENE